MSELPDKLIERTLEKGILFTVIGRDYAGSGNAD